MQLGAWHIHAPFFMGYNMAINFPDDKPQKRFPVRLLRGYFPADPEWPMRDDLTAKVKAQRGQVIQLPIDEARDVIKKGIGERADEMPI